MTHFPLGLSDKDGIVPFYLPSDSTHVSASILNSSQGSNFFNAEVRSLNSIYTMLNIKKIDILKMDIEGAEYNVIDHLKTLPILPAQILIEFHHRYGKTNLNKTKQAIRVLNGLGYNIFSISAIGQEYSFIKE